MSMIWRDPFETMTPLREAMNRLFEESFIGPRFELVLGRTFPLDVYESEDKLHYVIEASLPGFKPEEVQITAEGDTLLIQARKKEEDKTEKGSFVRRERYEGEMRHHPACCVKATSKQANIDAKRIPVRSRI